MRSKGDANTHTQKKNKIGPTNHRARTSTSRSTSASVTIDGVMSQTKKIPVGESKIWASFFFFANKISDTPRRCWSRFQKPREILFATSSVNEFISVSIVHQIKKIGIEEIIHHLIQKRKTKLICSIIYECERILFLNAFVHNFLVNSYRFLLHTGKWSHGGT